MCRHKGVPRQISLQGPRLRPFANTKDKACLKLLRHEGWLRSDASARFQSSRYPFFFTDPGTMGVQICKITPMHQSAQHKQIDTLRSPESQNSQANKVQRQDGVDQVLG